MFLSMDQYSDHNFHRFGYVADYIFCAFSDGTTTRIFCNVKVILSEKREIKMLIDRLINQ